MEKEQQQKEIIHIDPKKTKKIPPQVYEAYRALWKTDISGAETILLKKQSESQKKGSLSLWVETSLAEIYFWKFGVDETPENKKKVEAQLEKLEKIADQICENHNPESLGSKMGSLFSSSDPESESKKYILYLDGIIVYAYWHFLMCGWSFRQEERVKGAYHFQRCWSRLSETIQLTTKIEKLNAKIDPALTGMIDFGVGIYHFIISLVPPSLQIITTIVGFEADRDKAFEEFNRTIQSGCVWSPLATLMCIGLKHVFLDDKEGAKKDLEHLQQTFPNSIITCYFSGFMDRMNGEPLKSVAHYSRVLELVPTSEKLAYGINYQIGYAYLLVNNWEKVIFHFEKFLERPVKENIDKALRPYVCYYLSFAYFMQANKTIDETLKKKINTIHENAKGWIRPDESWDLYSKRKIREYEKKGTFDKFDELFNRCDSLREGQQWNDCIKILDSEFTDLLADPENQNKREYFATYYYFKGCCQKGLKLYDEAELTLRKALKEEGKVAAEPWLIPFSWLVLGEMFIEMKKWEEAAQCFDKTKNYKDYDWEKVLAVRIYGWRQTISKNWKGVSPKK